METLELSGGAFRARFIPRGARWVSFFAPDRFGHVSDVLLGYDSAAQYADDMWSFGAIVGRYANRIREARFPLGDALIEVSRNHGRHHLHGGSIGFAARDWTVVSHSRERVHFRLVSEDGDEGFPGQLTVDVEYTISEEGALALAISATTTALTALNLTNHAYFNLSGAPNVREHELSIAADSILEVDSEGIPTGRLLGVGGTVFDLRSPKRLGTLLAREELAQGGGFDHYFVFGTEARAPSNAGGASDRVEKAASVARLWDPKSGRTLEVETSEPGLQLYTSNGFSKTAGRSVYDQHAGVCLECMHYVDSVNQPAWPSTALWPGETYRQLTVYRFGIDEGRTAQR